MAGRPGPPAAPGPRRRPRPAALPADGALPRAGEVAEIVPLLLHGLDAPAAGVLRLLATLDGAELAPDRIGAIVEVPDAAAVCERLTEVGLLRSEQHGYRCPPDVAVAALGRTSPFPFERLCAQLTAWVARPDTDPAEVARHSRALDRAAALAETAGRAELAVDLAGPPPRHSPARCAPTPGAGSSAAAGRPPGKPATGRPRPSSSTRRASAAC
ncbi:hypothetical protein [Kitasatospora cheerisanensis]|uniref:Uncharacterized protein n=1 Tax=Kitasatospora cheerisanensis KCTC 2395 TaxID=1348663 RepID=A0A066YVY5_9ACTN|nr:hypothetical protein [Kitasatospora cheerisanensis]KDN82241.1 hypothetical protein KCH_59500 [Kitasatospora cheerisanensis KCTC 2395]